MTATRGPVVHYVNQFFAGLGSEEAAGHEPVRIDGAVGPGRALAAAGLAPDVTLACGDDRFGERESDVLATLLGWLDELRPAVLICGPAFDSGRYGYACGVLAREAGRRAIPVVTAMTPDSPGVAASEGAAYVVPTSANVAGMRDAVPAIVRLALTLAAGGTPGPPAEEGYLPRVRRTNVLLERNGAERAFGLVLAKLAGEVRTEIAPTGDQVTPPPGVADPGSVALALVTESGCVPTGNPDRLPTRRASTWFRYPLGDLGSLAPDAFTSVHAGFDTSIAKADPNRLVPLDAARELERDGTIGQLHGEFYTTSGVDTPVASAVAIGREIAAALVEAKVGAVILTGT